MWAATAPTFGPAATCLSSQVEHFLPELGYGRAVTAVRAVPLLPFWRHCYHESCRPPRFSATSCAQQQGQAHAWHLPHCQPAPGPRTAADDGKPALVSGVPPDAFSATGQLWGSPLYDWKAQKEDGYR